MHYWFGLSNTHAVWCLDCKWSVDSLCREIGIRPQPPAAVIPLGTGNGMSVNLGWGHRASSQWVKSRKSMADVSSQHSCLVGSPVHSPSYVLHVHTHKAHCTSPTTDQLCIVWLCKRNLSWHPARLSLVAHDNSNNLQVFQLNARYLYLRYASWPM